MYWESLQNIIENPNSNGIVVFVLGIVFILTLYHLLLFIQHKDRVYLYYSIYLALVFFAHLRNAQDSFVSELIIPIEPFLKKFWFSLIWGNTLFYFVFAFTFVNLKKYSTPWYRFMFMAAHGLLVLAIVLNLFTAEISTDMFSLDSIYVYFLIATSILAIFGYIPLFKMKHPLKNYIIVGSLILFISSLLAAYYVQFAKSDFGHSIFYTGVVIENLLFSLGLGAKQKLILKEKNKSQKDLIEQLQKNEELQGSIHKKLEQDVLSLTKKAESEKIEKIKTKYDKKIAELRVLSLRSQMNPHFIFNSLNAIKLYIIDNDKENAVYYLNKFSKLIRKILATTREKEIVLSEEIETMKLYIDIENIRFSNEIKSTFTIDENLNINTIKIPSLILQPFIENAIWHGLSAKKGLKKIDLSFTKKEDSYLEITIKDNGIGRDKSKKINKNKIYKTESLGIKLTEDRLHNFCKDFTNSFSLAYTDLIDKDNKILGTKVVLMIPLQ